MRLIDLTGQTFGNLTVVSRASNVNGKRTMWNCVCSCGNQKIVCATHLRSGKTRSCGCATKELISKKNLDDLTGKTFDRLTVIARDDDYIQKNGRHRVRWLCQCSCGATLSVASDSLKHGVTRSCGCYHTDQARLYSTTHGLSDTRLYGIYHKMKDRCYKQTCPAYPNYGGRGVRICDEWLNSFEMFYKWSIENGYESHLTIDRINVDGDYEPTNCRWTDAKTQSLNRRSNVYVEFEGKRMTVSECAEILNISHSSVKRRFKTFKYNELT